MTVVETRAFTASALMRSVDIAASVICHTPDPTVPLSVIRVLLTSVSMVLYVCLTPRTAVSLADVSRDLLVNDYTVSGKIEANCVEFI